MAVGDGGFKQVAFGFDKNEVNTYISDLRKKMKSMEDDMEANNKKTAAAEKLAAEADDRIKAATKEGEDKIAELEKQLTIAEKKAEKLDTELKKLKKELESERRKMSEALLSGKGVSAEANKAYSDIITKANADAEVIINDANAKAAEIVSSANASSADLNAKTNQFLDAVKAQIEALTAGFNTINGSAAELLGTEIPEIKPVSFEAAPVANVAVAEAVIEETAAPEEEIVTEITASESIMEIAASSEDMPAITEEDKEASQELASFDDVWSGNEVAQTIYNNEKKDAVPLVNPEAKDLFGQNLFNTDDAEAVTEVQPLDVSDVADATFDNKFDNDLLAQTMPSGSLEGMDDALLEAVKAAEAAFAVQPTNNDLSDFDMDEHEEAPVLNTEDELMKALREAEEALNSLSPVAEAEPEAEASSSSASNDSSAGSDPWADLQKQFEAMEQSGNFGAAAEEPEAPAAANNDPVAPSADDAAIWNFGDSGSDSSDDDMSGDMFGGFGGF